ncbi:MAG: polyhydroxyalkanoate synthesis repressor PhaR [Pseudomonadota bacterium]|nr:polyhydroxyalkanoate synthesis repressor PhaR [Pseudomonadota bacterium]
MTAQPKPVVIRKYANRRLYDTGTSAYITLDDLCARVKLGEDFIVLDAKTGQDLTRQVLTQIIFEQEAKGAQILPTSFLRSVIRFYDDKMQTVLQHYLEASMKSFMSNRERMSGMVGKAMDKAAVEGGFSPFNPLEEMTRQNVALFEKTIQMFNPFGAMFGEKEEEAPPAQQQKKRAKR